MSMIAEKKKAKVLILGAGLAGCTVANELALNKVSVCLVDTAGRIGGKVRGYGCKATALCNKCGLCLAAGLWEKVESSPFIDIILTARLVDLLREDGKYRAFLKAGDFSANKNILVEGLEKLVVASGFDQADTGFVEYVDSPAIISGSDLEALIRERKSSGIFKKPPASVAFIQCYGSRDRHEHSMYCSRVCCSYATRAAKLIKHFYPACRIVFFYMEMQMVEPGDYYQSMIDAGIEFIKCRPVKVKAGELEGSPLISYEEPASGKRISESFDLLVLSNGIRPGFQAERIADICGLAQDSAGFLRYVNADKPEVLLAGCASGPKKIEETYNEALALAKSLLQGALS